MTDKVYLKHEKSSYFSEKFQINSRYLIFHFKATTEDDYDGSPQITLPLNIKSASDKITLKYRASKGDRIDEGYLFNLIHLYHLGKVNIDFNNIESLKNSFTSLKVEDHRKAHDVRMFKEIFKWLKYSNIKKIKEKNKNIILKYESFSTPENSSDETPTIENISFNFKVSKKVFNMNEVPQIIVPLGAEGVNARVSLKYKKPKEILTYETDITDLIHLYNLKKFNIDFNNLVEFKDYINSFFVSDHREPHQVPIFEQMYNLVFTGVK